MNEITFPYKRYPGRPGAYTYRPVIKVNLHAGKEAVEFSALIDSGADQCTFPGFVAQDLGFKVEKGERRLFSGIGGSVIAYRHKTRITVAGERLTVNAYYSHQWDDMPFGLLGQEGFFSHFKVHFDYKKKLVHLLRFFVQ